MLFFEEGSFSVDKDHGEELNIYQLKKAPERGTFYQVDGKEDLLRVLNDHPPLPCSHEAGSHIHIYYLDGGSEYMKIR